MGARTLLILLVSVLARAPARASMDDSDKQAAFAAAAEVRRLVDKNGVSKADLSELAKRYAEMGFTAEELERAPREAEARMRSVDAGVATLEAVDRDLDRALERGDDAGYAASQARRRELRLQLSKDHDALTELQKTVRHVWKRSEYIVMAGIVTRQPTAQELLEMERWKDFHGRITKVYNLALDALGRDEDAERRRASELERRRTLRWELGGGALAASVLALGGTALWRRRRGRRPLLPSGSAVERGAGGLLGGVYRVEREVGRGAMGVVYEALDTALNRKVALKRMRDELRENPRELQLLLAEAQTVAALKHPGIVEIFNVLQDGGDVYLVFEFVEGAPLSRVLGERQRLTPAQTVGVAGQVAAAVDFAHARRVVHRDLKPANVMVSREGRAKVMDFGIAHQAQKTVARLTRAQSWGTPAYMAPEQELGQVSKAADIYALAACCYEMLTGAVPFTGPNFLAQKEKMLLADPSGLVAGLPREVDVVLRRGLAFSPQARFITASALVGALQGALARALPGPA